MPIWAACIGALLVSLAGCPKQESNTESQPAALPFAGVKLKLAVVDAPAMAHAIGQLSGEWNAQTGSELSVVEISEKDLEAAEALPADAVIGPSHLLGPLAEKKLLASVPPELLSSPNWTELFALLKLHEVTWGSDAQTKVKAVPFGSPLFVCYCRADLLSKVGRRPPENWAAYQELAKTFAAQKPAGKGPWCGAIEPLAPGWAGLVLLARAAPYAKHRDNYSTLFDIDTMEPLLTTPAITQALEELAAAAKAGPADPFAYTPAAARAAFWRGECAMALTWPTAAENKARKGDAGKAPDAAIPTAVNKDIQCNFAELPGSDRVYNHNSKQWNTRSDAEDKHVPLLAVSGRIGMVNQKSEHAQAAFHLLFWLAADERSLQVSAVSPATTLYRRSQMPAASRWVEKPATPGAAAEYATTTETTLQREPWLAALPLPGRAEYLAALDEAVAVTVRGQKKPAEALADAQAKWKKITERLGVESQRAAYRHSLGW